MYNPARPGYTYDPERARRLAKESGYDGKPIALRLIPNYYLNGMESAQVLLEMWKAVGINVRLELLENFKQVRAQGLEMHQWSNTYRLPDPTGAINVLYGPNSQTQRSWKYWTGTEQFNKHESRRFRLQMSVGCTVYDPAQPATIDELLARADAQMYEHKRGKKARLVAS
jgi:ABC-type transport system substrate-binding protein